MSIKNLPLRKDPFEIWLYRFLELNKAMTFSKILMCGDGLSKKLAKKGSGRRTKHF